MKIFRPSEHALKLSPEPRLKLQGLSRKNSSKAA